GKTARDVVIRVRHADRRIALWAFVSGIRSRLLDDAWRAASLTPKRRALPLYAQGKIGRNKLLEEELFRVTVEQAEEGATFGLPLILSRESCRRRVAAIEKEREADHQHQFALGGTRGAVDSRHAQRGQRLDDEIGGAIDCIHCEDVRLWCGD